MDADVLATAEEQAAKDRELLAELQERMTVITDHPVDEDDVPVERVKLNRAQRREQVKGYAALLAYTERQEPVRNATIIPRSKRRRRKGGNRA